MLMWSLGPLNQASVFGRSLDRGCQYVGASHICRDSHIRLTSGLQEGLERLLDDIQIVVFQMSVKTCTSAEACELGLWKL